jgi:hypothetical protein
MQQQFTVMPNRGTFQQIGSPGISTGTNASTGSGTNANQLTTLDQCLLRQTLLKLSETDLEALLRTVGTEHPLIAKKLAMEFRLQKAPRGAQPARK